MILPAEFQFSQSNLQDYVDCPYRFLLRYIKRVAWPAVDEVPVIEHEKAMQRGDQFHNLACQLLVGVPAEWLAPFVQEAVLGLWWQAFMDFIPTLPDGDRYPEFILSTPLKGFRLVAKYDLLMLQPGQRAVIFDWKTSPKKTHRKILADRIQTCVYPFVLAQAAAFLNHGQPFQPEQIEMIYWFSSAPSEPEKFVYSQQRFSEDRDRLERLIGEILDQPEESFLKTDDQKACRFCVYRSWCERGKEAGTMNDEDESQTSVELDIDFDQIAEIAF